MLRLPRRTGRLRADAIGLPQCERATGLSRVRVEDLSRGPHLTQCARDAETLARSAHRVAVHSHALVQ